jgi:hypothetical protein
VRIRLADKVEECDQELPADVDPVTMAGEEREELPPVQEPSPEAKKSVRPRKRSQGYSRKR